MGLLSEGRATARLCLFGGISAEELWRDVLEKKGFLGKLEMGGA